MAGRFRLGFLISNPTQGSNEGVKEIDGDREDDGRVIFRSYFG